MDLKPDVAIVSPGNDAISCNWGQFVVQNVGAGATNGTFLVGVTAKNCFIGGASQLGVGDGSATFSCGPLVAAGAPGISSTLLASCTQVTAFSCGDLINGVSMQPTGFEMTAFGVPGETQTGNNTASCSCGGGQCQQYLP
jgi:hypothetical protein